MSDVSWSVKTQKRCASLIEKMLLPNNFHEIVRDIYLPLTQIILNKKKNQPLLVSINGAQGTGKSTLTAFIKQIIETELDCHVAALSLDDFYLSRANRQQLAEKIHPLFITRGVPGTHGLDEIEKALDSLINRKKCVAPKFSKAIDDLSNKSEWVAYNNPVEVILFEGWCNNSPIQNETELTKPINELEENEDTKSIWRHYANEQLKQYHHRIFDHTDMCIMLKPPSFEQIYDWRSLQEKKLKANTPSHQQHIMSDEQLKHFIQHYERITRHTLDHLPAIADVIIAITADHSLTGITQKND